MPEQKSSGSIFNALIGMTVLDINGNREGLITAFKENSYKVIWDTPWDETPSTYGEKDWERILSTIFSWIVAEDITNPKYYKVSLEQRKVNKKS